MSEGQSTPAIPSPPDDRDRQDNQALIAWVGSVRRSYADDESRPALRDLVNAWHAEAVPPGGPSPIFQAAVDAFIACYPGRRNIPFSGIYAAVNAALAVAKDQEANR